MNKPNRARQWLLVSTIGILLLGLLLFGCANDEIQVSDPWARSSSIDANSAVYFVVHNHTPSPIELIRAESDIAQIVELHRSMEEQDVMRMVKQEAISILPGEAVIFKPGDYHVMLMGLKQDLIVGSSFELTLYFSDATTMTVQVPVTEE